MKSVLLKNTNFQELFIHRLECLIHNGTNKSFVWFYSRKLISFNSGFSAGAPEEGNYQNSSWENDDIFPNIDQIKVFRVRL